MSMRLGVRSSSLRKWHRPRAISTLRPVNNAAEAAAALVDAFANRVAVRTEELDRTQLRKLAVTLNRPIWPSTDPRTEIPPHQNVPPGYHLAYFTGGDVEENLAPDGSDGTFNPPRPFTRRMWAGGRMSFSRGNAMRTGEIAEERTRLVGATVKRNKAGEEMLLVEVEKEYFCGGELSVTDSRSWIFRNALEEEETSASASASARTRHSDGDVMAPSSCEQMGVQGGCPVWQLSWSPVGLFRFSALTFNGHKIHYNEDWTRTREGHPAPVVHGPLNLINLLDYWAMVHGRPGLIPREIVYRAMSPVYAGEKYRIRTDGEGMEGSGKRVDVLAERGGTTIMKASIWD